jgi:hypothetical protein
MVRLARLVAGVLAVALAAGSVQASEGMWMPAQAPEIAKQLRAAGLKLKPEQITNLTQAPMDAIVSIGGCSASFVSPDGLVATNHHCAYNSIQYNSKPGQDYLTNGFLARTLKDEVPASPGSRVFVIEELRDVTAQMTNGIEPAMDGRARFQRLDDNRKALIAACELERGRRCDVRAYYGGATYYLQKMLEILDVRLVYAPADGVGSFGGEIDNWQWPRHTGDFAFLRAYVAPDGSPAPFNAANVPFKPRSWLRTARDGVKDGDFVMVVGFPGTTERHRTAAETRTFYERIYPRQQKLLSDYSDLITKLTQGNAATTIQYANALRGADNFKKKLLGQMDGAKAIGLQGRKDSADQAFRAWVNDRRDQFGPAIAAYDAVAAEALEAQVNSLTTGLLGRAQLLQAARDLYRWAKEREKPDVSREAGFQDRDRRVIAERLTQIERRFNADVDRAIFEAVLEEYRTLPASARNSAFLPTLDAIGLGALYRDTQLGNTAERLAWMDRPAAAFEASTDPFIRLAVAMYPEDIAGEERRKDRDGRIQAARSGYMMALKAWYTGQGRALYPDANGTLRFTFGRVAGREFRDGMRWTPFTTIRGVLAKHTGEEPFNAPKKLLEEAQRGKFGDLAPKDIGTLPVNYLSTLDITNGNSGSATLNARGELVGLAFDGTMEGIISDWYFDESINRTIHVDSRYMIWVMDKVDGADRLLKEMRVR